LLRLPCSEVVEKFPALREPICAKLVATLPTIKSAKVYRGVFWILGEYTEDASEIATVFLQVRKVLGEVPILAAEQRASGGEEPEPDVNGDAAKPKDGGKPKVLADGTYATESAYTSGKNDLPVKASTKPPLRGAMARVQTAAVS
jgi:coatomer subunit beta